MFDIGAPELLVIAVVAILVIGPKEMPNALRMAGRWIGKIRRVSSHFKSGVDAMIREAELEEMDKKWQAQNEAIMAAHPPATAESQMEPIRPGPDSGQAEIERAAEPAASDPARQEPKTGGDSPDTPAPPP